MGRQLAGKFNPVKQIHLPFNSRQPLPATYVRWGRRPFVHAKPFTGKRETAYQGEFRLLVLDQGPTETASQKGAEIEPLPVIALEVAEGKMEEMGTDESVDADPRSLTAGGVGILVSAEDRREVARDLVMALIVLGACQQR